jgi:hypothetical protein
LIISHPGHRHWIRADRFVERSEIRQVGYGSGSRWALETLKRDMELGTDRSIALAAARMAGRSPMYRAESLSPREISTDLSIASGELYLFPVDCLWDLNTRELTYAVGKGTAIGRHAGAVRGL